MSESDPDTQVRMLLILIIVITLIGSLVITALVIAWRRQASRHAETDRRNAPGSGGETRDDAWQLSAERMVEEKMLEEDEEDDEEPLY